MHRHHLQAPTTTAARVGEGALAACPAASGAVWPLRRCVARVLRVCGPSSGVSVGVGVRLQPTFRTIMNGGTTYDFHSSARTLYRQVGDQPAADAQLLPKQQCYKPQQQPTIAAGQIKDI